MHILELSGCPGCGKTTVCSVVSQDFVNEGIKVGNRNDFYFQHRKGNKRFGLILRILFDFTNYPIYFDVLRIWAKYGKSFKFMSYIGSLVFFIYELIYTYKADMYDVLILDEGIVQYISSLFYNTVLPEDFYQDRIFRHLCGKGVKPTLVCCQLDIEENIRRLRNRNIVTRFSLIEDDRELSRVMGIRYINLNRIAKGFGIDATIDMQDDVCNNAEIIKKQIYKHILRTNNEKQKSAC